MAKSAIIGYWHRGTALSACFADECHLVTGAPANVKSGQSLERGTVAGSDKT